MVMVSQLWGPVSALPDFAGVKQCEVVLRWSLTLTFVLQVMMGGAWFHTISGSPGAVTQEALLSRATEAVHAHLHVNAAPIWSHVRVQKVEPCQCFNFFFVLSLL